jgi:hypothetical protein
MRTFLRLCLAGACTMSLISCAFLLEQPGGPPPKETPRLKGETETFIGKVVFVDGAYRFSLLKEPNTLLRLTKGQRESEFESQQTKLKKYFEKTLSVNGKRMGDWIWDAVVMGQWVPPGGSTGPNMNAPKPTRP